MREVAATPLDRLIAIMARLRDPVSGCEWDREQTFATIAPYTIEEAYEVADAIQRSDMSDLREELGDLLLQVVFHSRMAEEAGDFGFMDVAAAISAKLEARHPHIFGTDKQAVTQTQRWEAIKESERSAKGASSALDGVAAALPALMRAEKLQKRAARVGFDWPDSAGPRAKVLEEMDELARAETAEERLLEAGDLLFAAVNVLRKEGIAPEDALRAANAKFERRFRMMEQQAAASGNEFRDLGLDDQEALWLHAKTLERGETP
ncbi:nucleoside triphosphate pyrophosphohydrolase [uncultured Novosphingobium sp.]|uniref:nucleoside triphosphate pyrophosphohydrolase n=1 Tax=uncultured Novosphingobium sp. TaxID=292277 RepID=UPI0025868BC6|nr:nucleoside triphosphate pyrophosphohydrolase [uncultured Novosphingobium sp.]